MKTFTVELFHFDKPRHNDNDRLSIPLTRLFSGEVEATDEKTAAARIWIDNVGTHRWKKLDGMDAPDVVRSSQVDLGYIADQMNPTSIWSDSVAYLLDNQAEAWLVSVIEVNA